MATSVIPFLLQTAIVVVTLLQLLSLQAHQFSATTHEHDFNQSLFDEEEKTRLGSTPPSCHSKCNQCYPCMAIQAPTRLSHDRFQTTRFDSEPNNKVYSNYKPLGWKCRCGDHFYNT